MPSRPLGTWTNELRDWQQKVFEDYLGKLQDEYLIVATPGGGKTTAALRIGHELLRSGRIERIVAVVPTAHLKQQWGRAASAAGIELDYKWGSGATTEGPDYDGIVSTYQQFAYPAARLMHARLARQRRTLAILDEIHHAGDSTAWGQGIIEALGKSTFRLALSGTPFRSDRNAIPFVQYDDGHSVPDFSYSYENALDDGVCRQVVFPSFGGRVEYMRGDELVVRDLKDDTDEQGQSERLRAVLSPKGGWLRTELQDAHAELQSMRYQDQDAGGLVIAMDINHARAISEILKDISGESPAVALSDDPEASRKILAFSKSKRPWLVAVRMVSEGVDIPRLRVGVYATNTTTELFFRQAVGRFVRMRRDGPDEQYASFYIPEDDRLIRLALEIKKEREHVVPDLVSFEDLSAGRADAFDTSSRPSLETIDSEAVEGVSVYDGTQYESPDKKIAVEQLTKLGFSTNEMLKVAAVAIRRDTIAEFSATATEPPASTKPSAAPKRERVDRMRSRQGGQVGRLHHLSGWSHNEINNTVAEELGRRLRVGRPVYAKDRLMTEENWKLRMKILEEWIEGWEARKRETVLK